MDPRIYISGAVRLEYRHLFNEIVIDIYYTV